MEISSISKNLQFSVEGARRAGDSAPHLSAEQVARNSTLSETEKISQLSRQFEAVLLRQVLNDGFKNVIKSSFTDDSAISGVYQDMVTSQLAESISQSGSFGLAKSLEKELTRQLAPRAATQ